MIAVCLIPVYLGVNVWLLASILGWMTVLPRPFGSGWLSGVVIALYLGMSALLPLGFFIHRDPFHRAIKRWGYDWLGAQLHLSLTVLLAQLFWALARCIVHISPSQTELALTGVICGTVASLWCIYGYINARRIRRVSYEVTVAKCPGDGRKALRIALAADLHLGASVGCAQMKRMVDVINRCAPDLVVIAGDLFDNDYDLLEDEGRLSQILGEINAPLGVWAVYGNHDVQERILAGFTFDGQRDARKRSDPRMDAFLALAGIHLLQDEGTLLPGGIILYGRLDAQRPGRGGRKTPDEIGADFKELTNAYSEKMEQNGTAGGWQRDLPVILVDHQPRELSALAALGVDLDLSGHTHGGQLFPANLAVRAMWKNAKGYLKEGNMHSIVTSGAGLFGPSMRIGTRAEICDILVTFDQSRS